MLIEEHGHFWWGDEVIPEGAYAPPTAVTGIFRIGNDGEISLELNAFLPGAPDTMSSLLRVTNYTVIDRCIQGILKESGKRVLLLGVIRNGSRFSSYSISYETYRASNALVGDRAFPNDTRNLQFRSLSVDLVGFEEWLFLGSIFTERTDDSLSTRYEQPTPNIYTIDDAQLAIRYELHPPYTGHRDHSIALNERAMLIYTPPRKPTIEDMKHYYGMLQDLFILLTDSNYCLGWPIIHLNDQDTNNGYQLYFTRINTASPKPKVYECWVNFLQIREQFGQIFSVWKQKRARFGAAFYLYLGTRRGLTLYPEHRFVNLVWGVEALHRIKHPDADLVSGKLEAKVHRIVDQVLGTRDKRWLRRILNRELEPSLEQRIVDTLRELPLKLDSRKIRRFARECASTRNDISHFGGQRQEGDYNEYMRELDKKSDALSYLYHALLLYEIGIDETLLNRWIYEEVAASHIRTVLREVGLID
jgi:hypothetical protein